jgi:hypothetical protein
MFTYKGLPGRGPWRILEDCPAPHHNSLNAARGENPDRPRCVCPRALFLFQTRKGREAGRIRRERTGSYLKAEIATALPDLSRGACSHAEHVEIYRRAQLEDRRMATLIARRKAKDICTKECPIMAVCRAYILTEESPAGAWGGIWGGLDSNDRVRIRSGKH